MHCTKVGTATSDAVLLTSGVVQGSDGIGSPMFLMYINELIYILDKYNVKVKLFADDVKMYLKIVNDVCMQQLQLAIDALTHWAQEWQLGISVDKCYVLNIGTELTAPRLFLDNLCIKCINSNSRFGNYCQ